MKKTLCLAVLALALPAAFLIAQTVLGLKAGQSAFLAWDPPSTNTDGTPCDDIAGYRAAISPPDADLNGLGPFDDITMATIPDGATTEMQLTSFLAGRPAGDYRLWVLAYDDAGNESQWSDPLLITYDPTKPGKPVKVTVRK